MRSTLAAPVESSRPNGVNLTALAMAALILIDLAGGVLRLFGGTLALLPVSEQLLVCLGRGLVLLCIWNYWKGQDWARVAVLLGAFVIAAKDASSLIDHEDTLISIMSQPVRFLHGILAIFLLYFLNTRALRAWFKRMTATAADLIAAHLAGRLCTAVEMRGAAANPEWHLAFEHDAELTLNCPWRIVLDDNLAFASNSSAASESAADESQPWQLLQNLRVKAVRLAPRTSDLFLTFEMGIELQSWSIDPRLQQWKFSDPTLTVIADSVGVTPQAMAAPIPGEEPEEND